LALLRIFGDYMRIVPDSSTRHRFLFSVVSILIMLPLLLPPLLIPVRQAIFLQQSAEIRNLGPLNDRLERIILTAGEFKDLNFTRQRSEFEYRGNMYDVHSIVASGNRYVITVLWDKAESAMLLADCHQTDSDFSGSTPPCTAFMPYFFSGRAEQGFNTGMFKSELIIFISRYYNDPDLQDHYPPPELLT
jgi:hypothetical protein